MDIDVRNLFGPSGPIGQNIRCPSCDPSNPMNVCVHPAAVFVDRGGQTTLIRRDGVLEEALPKTEARGVVIEIRCFCETGHTFTLALQFHKGRTYVRVADLGFYDDDAVPRTLWRD